MASLDQRSGPVAQAAYLGVRAASMLPLVAPLRSSMAAARILGRGFGRLPANRARVERASERLAVAMPELDAGARRELVLRSYEHLAMLAVEVAALPRLITVDSWAEHVELAGIEPGLRVLLSGEPVICITGHSGNWELLGAAISAVGFPMHALYRPLDLRPLDDWLRRTRARTGLELIDKFGAAERLPGLLERREPVAFVADQNAGDRGLFVPFFGRLASTYKTIALLAVTHRARLVCTQARRVGWDDERGPGGAELPAARSGRAAMKYRMEVFDAFGPEDYERQPDPIYYITARYRRAIEAMVRSAPEQYLWMHRMWKSRPRHERDGRPFPPRLRERLRGLPWMDDAAVEAVVDRSDRDAALLRELGVKRLP